MKSRVGDRMANVRFLTTYLSPSTSVQSANRKLWQKSRLVPVNAEIWKVQYQLGVDPACGCRTAIFRAATFLVNGSPTKTAMVDTAGGRRPQPVLSIERLSQRCVPWSPWSLAYRSPARRGTLERWRPDQRSPGGRA